MKDLRPMVHIRLPRDLVRQIDHLAVDMDTDRGRAIEHLLTAALASVNDEPQ